MLFVTFTTENQVKITLNASLIDNIEWTYDFDPATDTSEGILTRTDGETYTLGADNAKLKKALGYED